MATGNGSNSALIQSPVAVVGMACRLPGAANPDEFWALLSEQRSAIGSPSADRLRANPRISGLTGGFLESVDTFDADFFGISPREASALDPQQRLLLELVWESIERTGTPPDELRGQEIGVYVGVTASDYALLGAELGEDAIDRFTLTGSNRGILANRISYTYGFTGPSLTVDTAQSSGLAAVHAAASAIRSGEVNTAFAAAVGLNLTRDGAVAAERFGGLSPSGRASVFDADADGYVRGEGAVVLVLKSLDQAKTDGDQVLAVLASSALNNDGATTSLTVPDAAAQARVVTRALRASGVSPDDIQYVELHGTGTKVGDPIEAAGLGDAIGRSRSADDPLLVGSVKPNIGHLEGAAGIVGLLKVVLAVHHRKIPATLGYRRINPAIDSDALHLRVVTATRDWPHPDRTLRAGVSSFGVGGTNAHVVVEESPSDVAGAGVGVSGVVPFVVSGRTRGGLVGQVSRLRDAIVDSGVGLGSVASSLVRDRVVFADRAVILAESATELVAGLDDVAASRPSASVVVGSGASGSGGVVGVVFAGQGSQRVGAGRELYLSEPVFAAAFDEIVALVDAELGAAVEFSIADVVWGAPGTEGLIDSTAFTQPVLFAVEVALFRLLQSRGVTVDVVLGHSVGAIAAVHVAGALSLADAVRLVVARARLMGELPVGGAMVAVGAGEEDVVSVIEEFGGGGVSVAAVNGAASVVVSGVEADAVRVADVLKERGRRVKRLTVSHAFHSVLMEPMLEQFGVIVAGLEFRDPVLTVVSDSLGVVVSGEVLADPGYWVSHVRGTVRFTDAVEAARGAGVDFVVEIAPSPALAGAIAETDGVAVVSLLTNNTRTHSDTGTSVGEVVSILRAVANVFVSGHDVHWPSVIPEAAPVPLPTYAFDRSRYWLNGTASANVEHPVPEDPAARTENSLSVDELVHAATAAVLGYARDAKVDTGRTFESLGLDSLGATELVTILSRSIGHSVSPGVVYDFPTPALLTAHLDGSGRRSDPVPRSSAESKPGDSTDPVVIVAVSGRFPGDNDSPESLWDFVSTGGDAVGNFPNDRGWQLDRLYDPEGLRSGSTYTRHGGFLSGAGDFDAEFFGISPREAASMDPQQRLVLQSTWELFERAAIDPATLAGTRTGVFIGSTPQEYGPRLHESIGSAEGFTLTGAAPSVVSGRVAYTFGLEGPAISVDTACSSSLVALHLAVQSIRSGESTSAIAGGVTVMANPGMFTEFSRQRGLSPDGRCKAFSADADGTGWSEAVSLLLVERLSDAQRLGHPVLAVVRGTAVNSDGASNGLTAPNGPSQQRVIRAALADAGLSPADIDVVEAHGTATTLGDPIEVNALIAVYGESRSAENPLWLGSLKSNIGHTQAAAGAAGITKIVQSFAHDELPPTLHADRPSNFVDWSDGTIRLAQTTTPWPRTTKPRRAGISSFGISGTNAHVVVEESPPGSGSGPGVGVSGVVPFVLSGRTRGALAGQLSRLRDAVTGSGVGLGSVASSLVRDRVVFSERAVVLAGSEAELLAGLDDAAASRPSSSVIVNPISSGSGGVVGAVFAGQGSQRVGAGRELYDSEPVFAAAFDEITALVDTELGAGIEFSIADVIWGAPGTEGLIDSTTFTQPVLFAVEVSLFRLLQSRGVTVDVVLGHSVGAIAAVHVAGVLSLEDAVRLVVARARLMGELPAGGAMVAVGAGENDVLAVIEEFGGGGVSLAAVNGAASVVVSGVEADVVRVADVLKEQGRRVKRLTVSHAFHSVLMEPMLEQFGHIVAGLEFREPALTVVSDSLGVVASAQVLADPQYWVSHVRGTVRFADAVDAARTAGVDFVVEIAPSPALAGAVAETDGIGVVSLLSNNTRTTSDTATGEAVSVARAVANVFVSGHDVHWANVVPEAISVPLPTYAFQNERYWATVEPGTSNAVDLGAGATEHPFLGATVVLAHGDGTVSTGRLSTLTHPWLADHVVGDQIYVPGTALLELALHSADLVGATGVEELIVENPLVLTEGVAVTVQVTTVRRDSGHAVEIYSHSGGGESEWTRHATGLLGSVTAARAARLETVWPPAGSVPLDIEDAYDRLTEAGLEYGPAFRGLRAAWRTEDGLAAEVELPADQRESLAHYTVHPALFDAALHVYALAASPGASPRIPFAWQDVRVHAAGASALRVTLGFTDEQITHLTATDTAGDPVLEVASLVLRPAAVEPVRRRADGLFSLSWQPLEFGSPVALGESPLVVDIAAQSNERDVHYALARLGEVLGADVSAPIVALTHGAIDAGGESPDIEAAQVWGLIRSLQTESVESLLIVDTDDTEESAAALDSAVEAAIAADENQVVLRSGRASVARLTRSTAVADVPNWNTDGTVLITGGVGGLGAVLARHLVSEHHVRRLLLVSRRGTEDPGAASLVAELTAAGAVVDVRAADVTDRGALARIVDSIPAEYPLTAVIHTAGVVDDGTFRSITPRILDAVAAPKTVGAAVLHEVTAHLDLAAFVVYSSVAGILGTAGQGAYAAANTGLDAFAAARTASGRRTVSLAWGLWEERSAITGHLTEQDLARLARTGLRPLATERALELFDVAVFERSESLLIAAPIDRSAFSDGVPAVLRGVVRPSRRLAEQNPLTALADRNGAGSTDPSAVRTADLLALVRSEIAVALGHPDPAVIGVDQGLSDLGLDSLTAVEIRNRLSAATGEKLPATLLFDHPDAGSLVEYLRVRLTGEQEVTASTSHVQTSSDDIVIVGVALRLPGGIETPDGLWRLLDTGGDAISDFPDNRGWNLDTLYSEDPGAAGTSYTRQGGFLTDAADFDAELFGISPREALATDPQQRLLLETTWEALERAGIDPKSLRGSRTGVFAGTMYHDYAPHIQDAPADLEGYLVNGSAGSIASGRISYTFGFEGPAISVDTACSSSLVALHLAAQSLRSGESDLALAGGVAIMSSPATFVEFSRQRALSSDGRCKAFAAAADGTGWGEGVSMLVVERRSDAERLGHPILAVVKGSAVNQDGASNGLTAPNGSAQQKVIRQALANAGLAASDIDVVEAHGTGTTLGDPIEAQALLDTYGAGRDPESPLWLGSLKSNVGHTQAAAGGAGIIKMILALQHGSLPRTLHVDEPTPHVDWSAGTVRLLTDSREWRRGARPRRAGISSFGVSGTNAHVIIEEPESAVREPAPSTSGPVSWVLSGNTPAALRGQAVALSAFLDARPDVDVHDVARSLVTARASLTERAVVTGSTSGALLGGLRVLAQGSPLPDDVVRGTADVAGKTVFVFPGQGGQWRGMAVGLYRSEPVFAAKLDECAAALARFVDWDVASVLLAESSGDVSSADVPSEETVDVIQPALWAVMIALAELWRSRGIEPDAVLGHSQGEIAAAVVAGVLSLDDGARVVALRSRAIASLVGGGAMAAVSLSAEQAAEVIEPWDGALSVGVVNSPRSVVISGDADAVDELLIRLEADEVRARRVAVDYASHSRRVNQLESVLEEVLGGIVPGEGTLPFFSTVVADWVDGAALDGRYWYDNLRGTVQFADATRALLAQGYRSFIEVGPHPVLTSSIDETIESTEAPSTFVTGTLRRDEGDAHRFALSLAQSYVRGASVDWEPTLTRSSRVVELPTYAFQRRRYWIDADRSASSRDDRRSFTDPVEVQQGERSSFVHRLSGLDAARARAVTIDLVRSETAAVLRYSDDEIDSTRVFRDLGLDSLTAVDLRNRLRTATGLALPATLIFDHPSPEAVTDFVLAELSPAIGTGNTGRPEDVLAALEDSLARTDTDGESAEWGRDVAARLLALADLFTEPAQKDGVDLDSATDEELFDLLDRS